MKNEREFPNRPPGGHWSEDRMLDRLYGLETPPELTEIHLHECPECVPRWQALTERRAALLAQPAPPVSEQRLRHQRQTVFARIEQRRPHGVWALAPAAATALLIVFGVALQTPAPVPETPTAAVISQTDRELFTEIAALMEDDMPRATGAFRGLFDTDNSRTEVQ